MSSRTQEQWLGQIGSVLETLNEGVIIHGEDRRVIFANSIFLEMIQMNREGLEGRAITEFYPPEDVRSVEELIARRETEGRSRYEFYMPQADGGRLPVVVTARQIQGDDGHTYSVVTTTDISEQKRAEMDLRHANAKLVERQRQIQEELSLAERIQQSLVPKSLTWGGISVEAYYRPAWTIGGDYGLVRPGDGRLDILVCDVSGHGISSALVANRIYSETVIQIEGGSELGAMLAQLNHFVVQHLQGSTFYFTVAAARFSEDHRRLQFAGAGHPPAMIAQRDKAVRLLESQSMVLGLFENAVDAQPVTETTVESGERLLIYTDGLTENFNAQGEMLGIEGLRTIVAETCHLPLPEMKEQILSRVAAWRHGPPADDVSLVLVEVP